MPLRSEDHLTLKVDSDGEEFTVHLDEDLKKYLLFLESSRMIKDREEAVLAALRIYKKLNMHEWLQYVYRLGDQRILIVSHRMLNDIFTSVSEAQLYEIARMSALKRRLIDPFDPELDLSEPSNWGVILNELENLGWAKFSSNGGEMIVEFLGVPIAFLTGYLETLFQAEFSVAPALDEGVYVLTLKGERREVWR
ncbi:hypothetical protein DRO27_02095 [Candidatus Bathyarchaeota archaeon]|nr:MAG: hypothetical protein DRO27_02095 [Candidatus Bathyarchaeota archaeon]